MKTTGMQLAKPTRRPLFTLCTMLLTAWLCANTVLGQATANPPQLGRGASPTGSYAISDIETINTVTGNMMLQIPVASLPAGRSGLSAGVNLVYNSKMYDIDPKAGTDPNSQPATWDELKASPMGGWRFGKDYQLFIRRAPVDSSTPCPDFNYQIRVYMSFPDGSEHEFRPTGTLNTNGYYYNGYPDGLLVNGCGNTYPSGYATTQPLTYFSTDGTFLRLVVEHDSDSATAQNSFNNWLNNPWTLYLPDGQRVTFMEQNMANPPIPHTAPYAPVLGQRIYDRNNHYIEIRNVTVSNYQVTRIVDQQGRYVELDQHTSPTTVSYKGFNNQTLTWTINWTTLSPGYYFRFYSTGSQDSVPLPSCPVVASITPPAQSMLSPYTFGYTTADGGTGQGEIASVTLPTGASVYYTYKVKTQDSPTNVTENCITNKTLVYNREYDGTTSSTTEAWNYDRQPMGQSPSTYFLITMAPPGGGNLRQYAYDKPNTWQDRLVYKTENADGSVIEQIWNTNTPPNIPNLPPINPYVKTEYRSVRHAIGDVTPAMTAIKDYNYDKNGNITQIVEYDWVSYTAVPRGSDGKPTGIPASAVIKKVTSSTWYNSTPDASSSATNANIYHVTTNPWIRALNTTEISSSVNSTTPDARVEYYYDNAATTGNLTEQRSYDSTKIDGSHPFARPLGIGTFISTSNQFEGWDTSLPLFTGRLKCSLDANGNYTRYTYGTISSGSTVSNLYPTQIVIGDNASQTSPVKRTSQNEYDFCSGLVTKAVDVDNNVTNLTTYDVFGRPTLVQQAAGSTSERRTAMEYSNTLRRVITRSDLNTVGDGQLVSISHYDQLGRIRLSRQLENAAAQNAYLETDGIKVQTRYTYTSTNYCELVSTPYRANYSTGAGSESGMGWKRSKYDQGMRMIELETFAGSACPSPWGTSTASTGKVITAYDAEFITVTDQALKARRSRIDGLGRLCRVDEPDGSGNLSLPTDYTYNTLDNLTQVLQNGIPNGGTTSIPQLRTFNYSSLGRLISATNPESGTTQYVYDPNGNLTAKTDQRSTRMAIAYDALNRPTQKTYPTYPGITTEGLNAANATPWVCYKYCDANGNNLPSGAPASFNVGVAKGRLVATTYGFGPVNTAETQGNYYGYDALGRAVRKTQRIKDSGGTPNDYPITATYNLTGAMLTETYPSTQSIGYGYDNAGRLASFTGNLGGTASTYALVTQYNSASQVERESYGVSSNGTPNGMSTPLYLKQAFNSRLQLIDVRLGTVNDATNYDRGRLSFLYNGTAMMTANARDAAGQELTTADLQSNAADNNGNLLRMYHYLPSGVVPQRDDYTYDSLNRVTSVTDCQRPTATGAFATVASQNFSYDRFGNRSISGVMGGVNGLSLAFNGNNRITTANYAYDSVGNLLNEPGKAYSYDGENHMVTATGGSYVYDGEGKRIKRMTTSPNQTWCYVYGISGELLAEYLSTTPAAGSPSKQYGYRGGKLLVTAEGTTLKWLVQDRLGSTRIELNSSGNVATRHDYLPFGEELFAGAQRSATNAYEPPVSSTRQRFGGYERDTETGLDFAQSRHYSSVQGRFTKPDIFFGRLTNPQTLNRYTYVLNNPLKWNDPTGHAAQDPGKKWEDECGKKYECDPSATGEVADTIATWERRPPSFGVSIIPVVGSALESRYNFSTGHPVKGTFYAAMAITDVALVKSAVVGGLKLVGKAAAIKGASELVVKDALAETGVKLGGDAVPTFINLGDNAAGEVLGNVSKGADGFLLPNGELADGTFDFVIQGGNVRVGSGHVALSQGAPVEYAGEITFRKGAIVEWTNASGHFRPAASFAGNAKLPFESFRPVQFPIMVGGSQLPIFR